MFRGERHWRQMTEKLGIESQRELENYKSGFDSWLDRNQIQDAGIDTAKILEEIEKTKQSGKSEEYTMKTIQNYQKAITSALEKKGIITDKLDEPEEIKGYITLGDKPNFEPEEKIQAPVVQEQTDEILPSQTTKPSEDRDREVVDAPKKVITKKSTTAPKSPAPKEVIPKEAVEKKAKKDKPPKKEAPLVETTTTPSGDSSATTPEPRTEVTSSTAPAERPTKKTKVDEPPKKKATERSTSPTTERETRRSSEHKNPLDNINFRNIKDVLENLAINFDIRGIPSPKFFVRQLAGEHGRNKKEIEIVYEKRTAVSNPRGPKAPRAPSARTQRFSIRLSCNFNPQSGMTLVHTDVRGTGDRYDDERIQGVSELSEIIYAWVNSVEDALVPQASPAVESRPGGKTGIDAIKETFGKIDLVTKQLSEGANREIDFNVQNISTDEVRISSAEYRDGIKITISYGADSEYLISASCTKQAGKDLFDISVALSRKEGNDIIPHENSPRKLDGVRATEAKDKLFSTVKQAVDVIKDKQSKLKPKTTPVQPAPKAVPKTPDTAPAVASAPAKVPDTAPVVASVPAKPKGTTMGDKFKKAGIGVNSEGKVTKSTPDKPVIPDAKPKKIDRPAETFLKIGDRKQSFDIGDTYSMTVGDDLIYFKPLRIEGEDLVAMEVSINGNDLGEIDLEIKELKKIPGKEWGDNFYKIRKEKN